MTTTTELVAATHRTITALGARFMMDPATAAKGKSLGFPGLAFYVLGRGGVLGDVHPDVVVAGFGYMEPAWLARWWEAGKAVLGPRQTSDVYTELCQEWGRAHLAGEAGLDRLAELLGKVSAAADAGGLSLFAAWRGQPLPSDAPAAVAQLLHVLRELRGSAHLCAVRAAGLTPFEASVVMTNGERSKLWGWDGVETPDLAPLRPKWDAAEAMTDTICEQAYAALSPAEADELIALLAPIADR